MTKYTNQAFAQGMEQVPVLGTLAKVLTIRSYEVQEDDLGISVSIPSVETIAADTAGVTDRVNEDIYAFCEAYAEEAKQQAEEYKEAFLATGGTQEEWAAHDIRIQVSYDILTQTEAYLSLAVSGTENWTSAYSETRYYTLDMHTGNWITLQDVLGEDYAALATAQVRQQAEAAVDSAQDTAKADKASNAEQTEAGQTEAGQGETQDAASDGEKNFSVDSGKVAEFAQKVQQLVASDDLKGLAEMTAYPVYVGFEEDGQVIESEEDLIALGAEKILTPELKKAIAGVDVEKLSASMAGFVMSDDSGMPNIIFGMTDGELKIIGFNY